jgi:hypothetical protein
MSIKVKLEDGTDEKFHKKYIVESLEAIGLDHDNAKQIAKAVEKHKGISEHEIKVKVFDQLDKLDPVLADRYMRTKKVIVKSEASEVDGNALLPEFLMEYFELRNGDEIDVFHGNNFRTLRAIGMKDIYHHQDHNSIFISHKDMKMISAKENHQVAMCKHTTNL